MQREVLRGGKKHFLHCWD